jgi:cytoskeletal protein CcmA (bactofilin family)
LYRERLAEVEFNGGKNPHCALYLQFRDESEKEAPMADVNRGSESGAYLGPGTKINGKLQFDGPATIDGEIEGEIIGQASVTIGQQAILKGKISAVSVVVQGKVTADVQAEKKLEIQPPGLVVGDVATQSLIIGDGAIFEGHVSMKKEGRVLPLRQDAKPAAAAKDNDS